MLNQSFHIFVVHPTQDNHSDGRKRPQAAKKRRFTAVIFTLFHRHSKLRLPFPIVSCYETTIFSFRISIHFWNDGLRRRINTVFCRFIVVAGRLRTVLFDLGLLIW